MKWLIVIFMVLIVFSLTSGLFYMIKGDSERDNGRMARALSWRIGLSAALFAFIVIAAIAGWIEPRDFNPSTH
ncbi:MAG: twin transmembrane helix small protein [Gammaproteobacteria bacterium]|nr:twin transmembrane helix small protein [Gammaproteobacteria bacterium]